jgi:DNA (cytosine-5)-methyltransferase 1
MNKFLNTIDLFAGCGGLYDGFEKAGSYKSVGFVEWEKSPCETLRRRLEARWKYKDARNVVLRFDIQRTEELIHGWHNDSLYGSNKGLKKIVGKKNVDIVIGGPPCQAYSIAGRVRDVNGMKDDYRNYLFESYLEVVRFFQPSLFVFENVEGILSAKPGNETIVSRITNAFKNIGYYIIDDLRQYALLNAADYGVPQKRKRVIIIGVKTNAIKQDCNSALIDFYTNILPSYKIKPSICVGDAISDLPPLYPINSVDKSISGKVSHAINGSQILNHIPRFHSRRDQEIFAELARDKINGKVKFPNAEALKELYRNLTGRDSNFHKYHVLDMKLPSNTIPAHLYKDGLRHIHPDPKQARSITVREAARLQSFDDDFEFLGSMGDQFKMIGNAVPPILSQKVALAIKLFFNKYF